VQHIVEHLIHNRRFWHRIEFSELSQLYISMSLKSLALSLVAIFIPVYLYDLGYSLIEIALFYTGYFIFRVPMTLLAGWLTVRAGPKHVLSYSYAALLVSLAAFLSLPLYGWPLGALALLQAVFNSFFFVGYHVDFSKVEDDKQAGKQLSKMNILVRTAAAVGPFIGGALATIYGVHVSLALAVVLVMTAIWPLMRTAETTPKTKSFDFASFNLRRQKRNLTALIGESIARQSTLVIWPLWLSVFVFTDGVYVKIGLVASISILTSLVAVRYFGALIDRAKAKLLLAGAASLGAVINTLRIFAQNIGMVALVNVSLELSESAQILVASKGIYGEAEAADDRVGYITALEVYLALTRAVFWLILLIGFTYLDPKLVFISAFWLSAIGSALMPLQKFKTVA